MYTINETNSVHFFLFSLFCVFKLPVSVRLSDKEKSQNEKKNHLMKSHISIVCPMLGLVAIMFTSRLHSKGETKRKVFLCFAFIFVCRRSHTMCMRRL